MEDRIAKYIREELNPEIKRLTTDVNSSHKNEISNWYERADWVESRLATLEEIREDLRDLLEEQLSMVTDKFDTD